MLYPFDKKKEIYKIDGAVGYELAQLENYALVQLIIENEIPAHEVPLEMTFMILDGQGDCTVEDNPAVTLKKGDVMTVPLGAKRGWKSTGETPLTLLAIRGSRSENA